jgi:mannose-6-phosphate isomerase
MDRIGILRNPVQEYAWGSRTFIPQLLGDPSPADRPLAELWMGAHPKAPSQVLCEGRWVSLLELIQQNPEDILGKITAKRFSNQLPFLFKVLAASRPLSLQAHPDREKAHEGYASENRLKTPLNVPHRSYIDGNHKPELICALTPFWALRGFRKIEEIVALADKIRTPSMQHELSALRRRPTREGFKHYFSSLITMDRETQQRILTEAIESLKKHPYAESAFEWIVKLHRAYPADIGALFPLLMNVVRLEPGEAMFTPAGELHSYLQGEGIELMADSDNVLRGGLTDKYVNVPELLRIIDFTYKKPGILRPESKGSSESFYRAPAKEFVLSVIACHKDYSFESPRRRSVEIMICEKGNARLTDLGSAQVFVLNRGTSIVIPAAVRHYRIEGEAKIYKAAVPID